MSAPARNILVNRLRKDLIGPRSPKEILSDRPSDVYLTGILYPQRHEFGAEEDERLGTEVEAGSEASDEESVGLSHAMRPASAGLSFAVSTDGAVPELTLHVSCGTYGHRVEEENGEEASGGEEGGERTARRRILWERRDHEIEMTVQVDAPTVELSLEDHGLPGMNLFFKRSAWGPDFLITVAMVNNWVLGDDDGRKEIVEKTFFQTSLRVRPGRGTRIRARPPRKRGSDRDAATSAFLYREAREFAVGHTCSATWSDVDGETVAEVATSWIPEVVVPRTSSAGARDFSALRDRTDGLEPLSADWLAESELGDLGKGLQLFVEAYRGWISDQQSALDRLPDEWRDQARQHLVECGAVADAMEEGARVIQSDKEAAEAFRLANRAIQIQRSWLYPEEAVFSWRPFQLGFVLLNIPSLVSADHADRDVMDLLWFPTGGGKTEAYLALVALTLFFRRLRDPNDPDAGAGVSVIMRYTLRLLTAQQFQRACALILACEYLRLGHRRPSGVQCDLGKTYFGIGLWVGGEATPNSVAEAEDALHNASANSPAQLESCPACSRRLHWHVEAGEVVVECRSRECGLAKVVGRLPIWTVDEDIYEKAPSLVIGTADKFAQVVRKKETGALFGVGASWPPPELIIQDELHLISGPLGTMAGLYEVAIDALCSREGMPPKLIGSTATIRRAEPQIRALFNRRTRQFPPPGLRADDSGFALVDDTRPGRLYLGVTTAGRSAKFTLQAVTASLLQAASDSTIPDPERDGYWTLVAYFNSLRELGGALVLMQDDVGASMAQYAGRREEDVRPARIVEELTSRRTQLEIRDKLEELQRTHPDPATIDVLLATNMISVGVDIPRLGLMVVNGQPKAMAEYIQATSRVGRSDAPGLIVSIYNNAKARDRSHYETFCTWHNTLYREVEASSVTPFASRARDRALHAPLVAMVRHMIGDLRERPSIPEEAEPRVREVADLIRRRAEAVDSDEAQAVEAQLDGLIDEWRDRAPLKQYWNDWRRNTSLLISAEKAASLKAAGRLPGTAWPTPNSLRNVDPGTPFVLVPFLKPDDDEMEEEGD